MKNNYELNEKEYKECLNLAILGIFSSAKSSTNPTSFFVVGQPGAGKSGLSSFVERTFQQDKNDVLVRIDPDVVGLYHKNHDKIIEEIPGQSYSELQKFISPALEVIRDVAIEKKVNTLTEGTFASTDAYVKILDTQAKAGYSNEVHIIAVHRLESLLSAMERQQEKIEFNLPPRTVMIEHHDRAYNNIFETLQKVGNQNIADKICIYRRGSNELNPNLVYTSGDNKYNNPIQALIAERNQNLKEILDKKQDFKNRITSLRNRIMTNEPSEIKKLQLAQLETIEKDFEQEVQKRENYNNLSR